MNFGVAESVSCCGEGILNPGICGLVVEGVWEALQALAEHGSASQKSFQILSIDDVLHFSADDSASLLVQDLVVCLPSIL